MIILLVRHGETDHNLLGNNGTVFNDADINNKGRVQSKVAAQICAQFEPDSVWTSPFLRCRSTAAVISGGKAKIYTVDELKEFDMGDWADLPYDQSKQLLVENNAWNYSPDKFDFRVPGGESWHDVADRCELFLKNLRKSQNESVVIVSHNATIRVFIGLLRGVPFQQWFGFHLDNAGVSAFEITENRTKELFVNREKP